jgi:energy-coupling factor transport system ATP-binding protein
VTVIIAEHRLERVIQFVDRIIYIEGNGETSIGSADEILKHSDLVPPIVKLARALNLSEIGTSVREVRRATDEIRSREYPLSEVVKKADSPAIQVKEVSHSYGQKVALNTITTTIHHGEIVAIMGRNGAGKSTLLHSIVGLHAPHKGRITVNGQDPTELTGGARRQAIGYVPQEPSDLLFASSVEEECSHADRDNELVPGSTAALLNRLVPHISLNAHPNDLSEGQRLALVLSIVLAASPDVLVLDEPTRGLDYRAKSLFGLALKEYATQFNRPVLLATHDVELVAELADRVLFLAEGDIVADGTTLEVLLSSPAFAPQVAKIMSPKPWLTVSDVVHALGDLS